MCVNDFVDYVIACALSCRRLSLLGIAHPVVGKTFQVLEVHQEKALHEALVEKKVKDGLFYIL